MLTQERYQTILQILSDRDAVTVSELSQMMGISESTVRRDLNYLDDLGKLKKVFGGATAVNQSSGITEASFETRENTMRDEKTAIAKYSATLIHDGDLVFIDAGTTTYRMIDFLTNKNAKFVTSGIAHARKLIKKGFSTYIIGGNVKPITEAVVGPESIAMLSKLNFTKAFLGTNGIDIDAGFTTTELDEGMVKETAVRNSYMTFVLGDRTKFRRVFPVTFSKIKQCCIITDRVTDQKYLEQTVIKEVLK